MPGLRLEEVLIDTDETIADLSNHASYAEIYPSLHLAWRLGPDSQLTASYSRRVDRPDAQALNPFRIFNGPLSFFVAGNPDLAPALTDFLGGRVRPGTPGRHRPAACWRPCTFATSAG